MNTEATVKAVNWVKAGLFALLLLGLYYSSLHWLVSKDWSRDDFTYGYLAPIVIAYILWEKRKNFFGVAAAPSWWGYLLFLPGIALFWIGELSGEFFTLYFSFWLVLVGLFWINLGGKKLKTIFFALFMLLAMFPPPHFINNKITFQLKMVSSQLGVWMMRMFGTIAHREGNVIDLGWKQLQVVDACSGLRYLAPLMVMGLFMSYFYKGRFWKKAVIVVSTIPLTIFTNAFRIAMTGILYERWGPEAAEGFFHGFSGWFIFMFGMVVLFVEMWGLSKIGGARRKANKGARGSEFRN